MKKLLSYLLVFVMVTALTACSPRNGAKETETAGNVNSTKDEKTEDTKASTSGDNNTLTVWCWDPRF